MDTVGVGAKRSTHTVYSANMGGRDHYLCSKMSTPTQWMHSRCSGDAVDAVDTVDAVNAVDAVDAVNAVDAVGVGARKSTHTVYSANMGGGDHYL